jgi:hypothetical protein
MGHVLVVLLAVTLVGGLIYGFTKLYTEASQLNERRHPRRPWELD